MAEFTRRSRNRRVLQNIDTTKASKKQVYDFYKAWKKQYGVKGKTLDFKSAKKADIVRELYRLEAHQHAEIQLTSGKNIERQFERKYEKIKQKIKTPGQEAVEAFKKLQQEAEKLEAAGKLPKGKSKLFEATTEPAKPRHRTQQSQQRRTPRQNVYYKGRYAHDYIKKMVDDSLLDTDTFEDSKEIWYAISLIVNSSEDFDFFKANYEGEFAEGSRDYYLGEGGFEDFLNVIPLFENDMRSKGENIPEKYSDDYKTALSEWINIKGGINKILRGTL